MESKKEIRTKILRLRDSLAPEERERAGREIRKRVMQLREYRTADNLLCYISYHSEVPTGELIRTALAEGKRVYCPRVENKRMEFYRIRGLEDTVPGIHGIPQPDASHCMERFRPAGNNLVIVPGVAFDGEHHRIGYGGGYYDRYLSEYPHLTTAAVCFDCQLLGKLPALAHDRRPAILITPGLVSRLGDVRP